MKTIANKLRIVLYLCILVLCCSCSGSGKRLEVDGDLEPAEPAFLKNIFSMHGVDSNNDGIRDDVERWLNRKFPGDENYNFRNLYKQEARALGLLLEVNINTKAIVEGYWEQNVHASKCAVDVYNSSAAMIYFGGISQEIQDKLFNTPWRSFRKYRNESKLGGVVLPMNRGVKKFSTCEFEVKNGND